MNKNHNKSLEEIWNTVPPDYYQKGVKNNLLQRIWHTRKLKIVLEFMNKHHKNILDVGCASGWFLAQISAKYPRSKSTGIDSYKKAINYGKKIYKSISLICADAHNLPFPDNSFDVVICTEVLEHVTHPQKVLQEMRRILSPQGIAIIEMDTGNLLFRFMWYWWTHVKNGVWKEAHLHAFNTKKLERMIQKNRFFITEKKVFNSTMAVAFKLQKKM